MDKNPKRLELRIFKGEHALPILESAKASFDDDPVLRPYDGLTREDTTILLTQVEIVSMQNKEKSSPADIEYRRDGPVSAQPSHDPRKGATIHFAYERVDKTK